SVPQRCRVLVVAVDDLRQRHPKFVLVTCQLDTVLDVWHFLAEGIDPGKPARGALHECSKRGTEQVRARIGDAAEFAGLERGTGGEKRAAGRPFLAGLFVSVVGHLMYTRWAPVGLDILVADAASPR